MAARLSKPADPAPRNITRADLEKYLALREERLKIESAARAIAKQEADLGREIQAYVASKAGKTRSIDRSGYRASILSRPGSVSWKGEFVARLGQPLADELAAAAPPSEKLEVVQL